jgi:ParB family chromosome partitioning protein
MSAEKPRRLGRGLDALLGQQRGAAEGKPATVRGEVPVPAAEPGPMRDVAVDAIVPNHYQPRKEFRPEELRELAESIKATGLLQPITVRAIAGSDRFELVAGERRLRAVRSLGWKFVPAIVRDYDDRTMLTLALVENLQREDLNPIEEAEGYARLSGEFGLTQNEIAELVGKDRSTVANLLRVLQLPASVRRMLENGELTLGHARPLLALEDEALIEAVAKEAVEHGLSVRSVEERIRQDAPRSDRPKRGRPRKEDTRSAEVKYVEDMLRRRLQTDVAVLPKPKDKGELRIRFYSTEDLNRILELIGALE